MSDKSVSKAHATTDKAVHRDGRKEQTKGKRDQTSAIRSNSFLQDVPVSVLRALRLLVVAWSHQGGRGGGRRPGVVVLVVVRLRKRGANEKCKHSFYSLAYK